MSRFACDKDTRSILGAAERWRDAALVGGKSIFGSEEVWTNTNIETLNEVFTLSPDESDRSFLKKLEDQLVASDPQVKMLAAEIMWLLLLCPSNLSARTKRSRVQEIWNWSGVVWPEASDLLTDEVLKGIGSAGPGFNNHRPRELTFCINFLRQFRALAGEQQKALLERSLEICRMAPERPRCSGAAIPSYAALPFVSGRLRADIFCRG